MQTSSLYKACILCLFLVAGLLARSQDLYPLTKNLFVKIDGKYPEGYKPNWRIVGTTQNVQLTYEQYLSSRGAPSQTGISAGIVEYQGKSVFRFRALAACECVAEFELPQEKLVIDETPVKLTLTAFRKVQLKELDDPNAPCQNSAVQTQGGWKGYAILSADKQGNLTMSVRLENYAPQKYRDGALMYSWSGNNISIPNLMTPDLAAQKLADTKKREEEKKRMGEMLAQKEAERKYLNQQNERNLKIIKVKPEANPATVLTYKGYALKKVISLEKLVGSNISKKEGVSEAYQTAKDGFYTLLGSFDFGFKAADYEPHEKDEQFALSYCLVKVTNNYAIDIATYAMSGDIDKLVELGNFLKSVDNTNQIIDKTEQLKITGYLKSKD